MVSTWFIRCGEYVTVMRRGPTMTVTCMNCGGQVQVPGRQGAERPTRLLGINRRREDKHKLGDDTVQRTHELICVSL